MIARAAEPDEYAEISDMAYDAFKKSELGRTIIRVTTGEDPRVKVRGGNRALRLLKSCFQPVIRLEHTSRSSGNRTC